MVEAWVSRPYYSWKAETEAVEHAERLANHTPARRAMYRRNTKAVQLDNMAYVRRTKVAAETDAEIAAIVREKTAMPPDQVRRRHNAFVKRKR